MAIAPNPITPQLEGIKSGMHSPRPLSPGESTSHSLFVQPPSALGERVNKTAAEPVDRVEDIEKQHFDDIVASVYSSTPQDPFFYIQEEKLDEKDTMLMDVPNLPPPTVHFKEPALFPKEIQDFIALKEWPSHLSAVGHGSNGLGSMRRLAPVKDIKYLALDLSWRPFNFGRNIPTDEEVAEIATPIQAEDEILGYRDEKHEKTVRVLLDIGATPVSAEDTQLTLIPKIPRGCDEFAMSPVPKRTEETGHVEYLLTRRERMKVSSTGITLEAENEVQTDADADADADADIEQSIAPLPPDDEREDIPARNEDLLQQHGCQNTFDSTEYYPCSRTDLGYSFDDSGVNITENALSQFSPSQFNVPLLSQTLQDDDAMDRTDENKENMPPCNIDGYRLIDCQPDLPASQYDWNEYFELPGSSFEPLSFASQSQVAGPTDDVTNPGGQDVPPLTPSAQRVKPPKDDHISTREHDQTGSRLTKRRKLDDLVPASSKDLFSTFIGLRNQATPSGTLEHYETQNDMSIPGFDQALDVPEQMLLPAAPDDVLDQSTVGLPEHWVPAVTVHRYLASMALIQKRALVRELQEHHCRVALVERYGLCGIDIILDPDFGALFVSLLSLPAHLESVVERISCQSWRYTNVLVVFEAFPGAQSFRADRSRDGRSIPYAYTPPVCKAIKKLRRNLSIAEGCGAMNPQCTITWAFANDVKEAAKFVRCFGEEACTISTSRGHGRLWDEREWLEEEREGESDLAKVHGMNAFAAFLMLYDRSIETILNLPPEVRMSDYGQLLGEERMKRLNDIIEHRLQQIAPAAESAADHSI